VKIRSKARAAGISLLAIAILATVTQPLNQTPAQTDPAPVTVITSPPLQTGSTPPLTVSVGGTVSGTTATNPAAPRRRSLSAFRLRPAVRTSASAAPTT
jgi:hypothetical protein